MHILQETTLQLKNVRSMWRNHLRTKNMRRGGCWLAGTYAWWPKIESKITKKSSKMVPGSFGVVWGSLGRPWEGFGETLGRLWEPLGRLWEPLGTFGDTFGSFGETLGGSGKLWGSFGDALGNQELPARPTIYPNSRSTQLCWPILLLLVVAWGS